MKKSIIKFFLLLLPFIMLAVLELICVIFDWGNPVRQPDPYQAFGEKVNFFSISRRSNMVSLISKQRQESFFIKKKPNTIRIMIFGGSAAAGMGNWLKELSPGKIKDKNLEIINLAVEGYGSFRMVRIIKESMKFQPDIILIYSGNNEFVEKSFRQDVFRRFYPIIKIKIFLRKIRIYNVLAGFGLPLNQQQIKNSRILRKKEWEWEYNKFKDLKYSETQEVFRLYKNNLLKAVDIAKNNKAKVLLLTVLGNEMSMPFVSIKQDEMKVNQHGYNKFINLIKRGDKIGSSIFSFLLPDSEKDRIHWFSYTREKDKVKTFYQKFNYFKYSKLSIQENSQIKKCLVYYEKAYQIYDKHAGLLFRLGLCYYKLGLKKKAKEFFVLAGQYDHAPRKATIVNNNIIRIITQKDKSLFFLDAVREFEEHTETIIDWDSMIDHCHLNANSHQYMAHIIIDKLKQIIQ